jgi:transcription-repair coupling factor (superfamily II helicase)
MAAGVLADVMQRFAAGAFDVLLCTTIVESGLDISNANTILIDRADRFGLGELYQLRGRVGRSRHKAYAYMLLPVHAHVDPTARRRIQAIQQYSGAGAAFRLAMRDLELRGAGNLLGREQSGHITAVGFGLYCQLLRRTVARLKGEAVPPVIDTEVRLDFVSLSPAEAASEQAALIPLHYVDDERVRLNLYRRIAEAVSAEELDALRRDFRDRFGPLPGACDRLLKVAALRVLAARQGIGSVVSEGSDSVRLAPAGAPAAGRARTIALKTGRPTDRLDEVLSALGHRP